MLLICAMIFHQLDRNPPVLPNGRKGPRKNKFLICAPLFASDLAATIERNRRRRGIYVEDFAIEERSKMA